MTDDGTVHDTLEDRAFLHDDPEAYLAGVDDAVAETEDRDDHPVEGGASDDGPSAPASRS